MIARTAKEAKLLQLPHYFTGKPCQRGHIANRRTNSRHCVLCSFENRSVWRTNNRERDNEHSKKARKPDLHRIAKRKWRERNRERDADKLRSYMDEYREKNKDRLKEYYVNYCRANPHKLIINNLKRKASVRIPPWANLEKIKSIYLLARSLGKHVDHIIPVRGKIVCGLHCEDNLQILSQQENSRKGNKFNQL